MFHQLIPQMLCQLLWISHCKLAFKTFLSINLDRVITILGEWSGETAAGNDIKAKFKNPCYLLTVPSRGKYHKEVIRYIWNKGIAGLGERSLISAHNIITGRPL